MDLGFVVRHVQAMQWRASQKGFRGTWATTTTPQLQSAAALPPSLRAALSAIQRLTTHALSPVRWVPSSLA